ncbi:MAG: NAD(P)/FAD-dependent oxidoreductase [Lachnospiraceae bacterium]|nr:NAD(P)/FAD-dependent oxidoreductase [Lachnospiraceae bacterium]
MFDVIVIGAGPAGSTAAKILAESGFKVLLTEKFAIPRYKSCSGQLIRKSIDLIQEYYGMPVPAYTMCTPKGTKGMMLTDDRGRISCFEQEGLNVWRSSFDKWLADQASLSGAEIRDKTAALACREQRDTVTVMFKGEQTCTEEASYVIDCGGVTGTIKRKLLKKPLDPIYTYQTYNQGSIDLDHRFFHAFLHPELSEYDAWFNVKDDLLVIGVAVKDISKTGHYYDRFTSFLKENHGLRIDKQLKTDKWIMSRILPGCPVDHGMGRMFFAGEAAGFLNPMGEGISAAVESGYCIARAITDNFDNPEMIHAEYVKKTETLHGYMKRQWSLVGEMADSFRDMRLKDHEERLQYGLSV